MPAGLKGSDTALTLAPGSEALCSKEMLTRFRFLGGREVEWTLYFIFSYLFDFARQAWQKRYLVLRDAWTDGSDTCLELYANIEGRSSASHTVNLRHVMLVDICRDSKSFPHAFTVYRSVASQLYQLYLAWHALCNVWPSFCPRHFLLSNVIVIHCLWTHQL